MIEFVGRRTLDRANSENIIKRAMTARRAGGALDTSLCETWAFFRRTQPEELGGQTCVRVRTHVARHHSPRPRS